MPTSGRLRAAGAAVTLVAVVCASSASRHAPVARVAPTVGAAATPVLAAAQVAPVAGLPDSPPADERGRPRVPLLPPEWALALAGFSLTTSPPAPPRRATPAADRRWLVVARVVARRQAAQLWALTAHARVGSASDRAAPRALGAVRYALGKVGAPYVWAATGPHAFDCSGLTQAAYRSVHVPIPRVAVDQFLAGHRVAPSALLPGDLVFFATDPLDPLTIHHVGLYLGGGLMVDAPHTGTVVRVEPVWPDEYAGAVRVVPAAPGHGRHRVSSARSTPARRPHAHGHRRHPQTTPMTPTPRPSVTASPSPSASPAPTTSAAPTPTATATAVGPTPLSPPATLAPLRVPPVVGRRTG